MASSSATAVDAAHTKLGLRWLPIALGVIFCALLVALLSIHVGGQRGSDALAYGAQVVTGLVAVWYCVQAFRRFNRRQAWAWACIAAVVIIQVLGVVAAAVVDLSTQPPPFSPVSALTVASVVCIPIVVMAAGLLISLHVEWGRLRTLLDAIIVTVSAFFIAYASAWGDEIDSTFHKIGSAFSLLPSGSADILYVVVIALIVLRSPSVQRRALWMIAIALTLAAAADIGSAFWIKANGYSAGQWFAVCWAAGYVALALAAVHMSKVASRDRTPGEDWNQKESFAPYIAVSLAVVAAVVTPLSGRSIAGIPTAAGVLMLAALAMRQSIAMRENRQLAKSLRRQADVLRSSEARFRSLVQNSSDTIIVLDALGVITYVSPTADQLLGTPHGELLTTSLSSLVHPDDQTRLHEHLGGTDESHRGWATIQFRAKDLSGQWRDIEASPTNLLSDPDVGGIVLNARDVTDQRKLEEQLRHQAFHDPLTGLANRALLRDRVERALLHLGRTEGQIGLLFIDLDNFKDVNDTLGHSIGDRLLAEVGRRIGSVLRTTDTAARLGGDEFAILLERGVNEAEAIQVAHRILDTIKQPAVIDDTPLGIGASIGIALGDSKYGADDLLRRADVAMYQAKNVGKGDFAVFDDSMDLMVVARLQFEVEMHRALTQNELIAHYQPIVDTTTGRIEGVEALVRWEHPTRGFLPPSEFVDLAEETGQIVALGKHMLRLACTQAARWVDMTGNGPYVSVNVSSKHFQERTLVEDVKVALTESGLPGERLVIEVTESALLANVHESMRQMERLREMNVRIALDDFGTGYSSLGYLRELPVDVLKIDRSFVTDLGVTEQPVEFLRAIHTLSTSLKLVTIAEGVEDVLQLGLLRDLGINRAQGYLFSKPVEPAAFIELLRTGFNMANYPSPPAVAQTA